MRILGLAAFGLAFLAATLPARAQGDGGYAPGCPGAETVRMSGEERERARALHQTNDSNGGRSSIDKSCKTWEGGGTAIGPLPGTIHFGRDGANWGRGGAHTRF